MKYYFRALKNYAVGDGRASRREVIWYFVFHYLFVIIISFLDGFFGFYSTEIPLDYGYMTIIYMLATACPTICLQVRRLHDVGKSGSWWWATKVPILNLYVLYLLYLKRGDENANEYGAPVIHTRSQRNSQPTTYAPPVAPVKATAPQPAPVNTIVSQPVHQNSAKDKICFCRKCGNKLIDDAIFCNKCGTKIVKE
jgi:uncharacterized membrane protein YhaH (DUF805 family)